MNFELGKQYIVEVTDKGIIPIDEFSTERFFDKDNDDLEFLTDEEKAEVINQVLADVEAEIKRMEYHMIDCDVLVSQDEVLDILDNIGKAESEVGE